MDKIKLATVWLGGCSGCHMSFLDLDEFLIDLNAIVEVVFSPIVDAKQYPEGVDICLVEGAICNQEHLETASLIRRRTHIVVSFGDCAGTGNVTALRNPLRKADRVLDRAYIETVDLNPRIPKEEGIVPPLLDRAIPLHERIHVDYYLVGCPPPAERIKAFVAQLIAGKEPVMTPDQIKFG